MTTLLMMLDIAAAGCILAIAFLNVNAIHWKTWTKNPLLCVSAILLAVGSVAVILKPYFNPFHVADRSEVLLHIGVAAWLIANRRRVLPPTGKKARGAA